MSCPNRGDPYKWGMAPRKRKDDREPKDDRLNLRVSPDLMRRIRSLEGKAGSIRDLQAAGTIDRSKIAKAALIRGLEALEIEAGILKPGRAR